MNEREELEALRRMAELEAKAGGQVDWAAKAKATNEAQAAGIVDPKAKRMDSTGTATENFAAGAGKAPSDMKLGIEQVMPKMIQSMPPLMQPAAALGAKLSQLLGIMRTPEAATIESDRRAVADKPLMDSRSGFWGNVAGNVAVTAPTVGTAALSTLRTAPMVGAGLGFLQPVTSKGGDSERWANTGMGAGGSLLGAGLTRGAARIVSPNVRAPVRTLMNEGVTPTPGQIMGGAAQVVEDKMTSLPVVGDAISASRRRALEAYNRAIYNRATAPIGARVDTPVGRAGVEAVRDTLGNAYDDLLPRLRFQADEPFNAGIANLRQMAGNMPPQQAQQFERLLQQQVLDRMTPDGLMSGQTLKQVESELGRLVRGYRGDAVFDNRQLGDALREAQNLIRQTLTRSNPDLAEELARVNSGYSMYTKLRDAASRMGSKEGVVTPAQLSGAVRAADKSVGKGSFATGNAAMQDLSDAGVNVLGPKYPDSGSIGRLFLGGGAAGAAAMLEPTALAAMGGGAALYSPLGQRVMAAALARRPDVAQPIGQMIRRASAVTAPLGAAASLDLAQ